MSKRERQAYREGIKVALGSVTFLALSIAYMLYAIWIY